MNLKRSLVWITESAMVLMCFVVPMLLSCDVKSAPSETVRKKLGDQALAILNSATRVEVFRVDPDPEKPGEKRIARHLITATGKEQGKEFAAKLATVLQEEGTYAGKQFKCFDPGVAFRIWHEKESVEVVICFSCENLRIIARDAEGKEIADAFGLFGGARGNYPKLVKLAKKAFPEDKEIQALKETSRL